ncbi:hypothetical protein ACHAXH_009528 [Discostella pseudostelligera]
MNHPTELCRVNLFLGLELVFLPLVILVALMVQPCWTFVLACNGLMPLWFGQVDNSGNMWNGTLFAGVLMTICILCSATIFQRFLRLAFSMTNSSLILLRYESPDDFPGLLEKLLLGSM